MNNQTINDILDASVRGRTKEIVEYILRGNGRRIVPKAIYAAAWELQYALSRMPDTPPCDKQEGRLA